MTSYFIQALDRQGAIALAHRIQCSDDLDALSASVRGSDYHAIEIWHDTRLVARVKLDSASLDPADARNL
ncbi:MAG TPA: hypothetical protein VN685_09600 [Rhizomicrobium sp.]|jgi:hypothetical protein|nr:hypothetical protein [Rhizomicrobium sp.]